MGWLFRIAASTGQPVIGPPVTEQEAGQILAAGDLGWTCPGVRIPR